MLAFYLSLQTVLKLIKVAHILNLLVGKTEDVAVALNKANETVLQMNSANYHSCIA